MLRQARQIEVNRGHILLPVKPMKLRREAIQALI